MRDSGMIDSPRVRWRVLVVVSVIGHHSVGRLLCLCGAQRSPVLHRLLDSRASCGVRRPPHSSGCCSLWSSVEAVEASGVFGESGACLGVMGGWQLSGLCHCSPAWSVPPLGLLCCSV